MFFNGLKDHEVFLCSVDIKIETIGGRSQEEIELYAKRNVHGVPLEIIQKMAKRWED